MEPTHFKQSLRSPEALSNTAILLVGHGSVERAEDIPAFLSKIRHGRPTPQSIIHEVTFRWNAIGGSPFLKISQAQAIALEKRLNIPVRVGMRLWHPYIEEIIPTLIAQNRRQIVSVPLAPFSVHIYNDAVRKVCNALGVECIEATPWGQEPALLEAFADVIESAWHSISEETRKGVHLLFTAHSLPMRILQNGDSYEQQVRETANNVMGVIKARGVCSFANTHVAFQSQGMDGGDWLGPNLHTIFSLLRDQYAHTVIICAIGFLSDHTEVLYDLDIEAKAMAKEHNITVLRAASLNTSKRLIDALENVAQAAISHGQATKSPVY